MVSKVIDLTKIRADRSPAVEGTAECIFCHAEWEAVIPPGVTWLECPSCGAEKGRLKYRIGFEDECRYVCDCGCDMFTIGSSYQIMCPNCGHVHGHVDDIGC